MLSRKASHSLKRVLTVVGLVLCVLFLAYPPAAHAGVTVTPPYTITPFASSQSSPSCPLTPGGYSKPDSLVQWYDHILVGYGNNVAKDGTDGKYSTIVQYSLSGKFERTFCVKGHNDGLRLQPDSNNLWALQNEDTNPNLVIIDLELGLQKLYKFPPPPHSGGYDDIIFKDDQVFMTASNPTLVGGVNPYPALVSVTLGTPLNVTPVLYGNATATDIPTGTSVTLNLMDPDSLTADARGNIVLDDQADGQLIFITPGGAVGRLSLSSPAGVTVDDTAFAPRRRAFLLVSDINGNTVYRIDRPTFEFEPGTEYSASDNQGIAGTLNLDTGVVTPIVTGLGSGRGLLFVSVGEDEQH